MRHTLLVQVCSVALTLAASASLHASSILIFTDSDSNVFSAFGTLIASDNGDGTFTAVSGSGFFNTDPITLIPGSGTSPSGLFTYNNLLYPNGNPLLDNNGLLFTDTVTGAELNIWGNGQYPPSFYSTYIGLNGGYPLQDDGSVFTLSDPTPEPSTWLLLLAATSFMIAYGWKRSSAQTKAAE